MLYPKKSYTYMHVMLNFISNTYHSLIMSQKNMTFIITVQILPAQIGKASRVLMGFSESSHTCEFVLKQDPFTVEFLGPKDVLLDLQSHFMEEGLSAFDFCHDPRHHKLWGVASV